MKWIYNPILKVSYSIIMTFVSGVLCSALIVEITNKEGELEWGTMFCKILFYIIIVFISLTIWYNIKTGSEEFNYRKKLNTQFLEKFIKDKGLDVLADEVASAIKENDKRRLSGLLEMKELITINLEKK